MLRSILPAAAALLLLACQNKNGGEGSAVPASPSNSNSPAASVPMNTPTTTSTAQPGPTAPGLNPPHGEPGHVCEIPVGQPLDGSGSAATSSPQDITIDPSTLNGGTTTITPSMTQPGAVGTTAPGMNPPHGEPGHVCEVPVGQPLP